MDMSDKEYIITGIEDAARRWNPAGLPANDAMQGMMAAGLSQAIHEMRDGMDTAEWTAVGLLNLARCLAHNRQGGEVDA